MFFINKKLLRVEVCRFNCPVIVPPDNCKYFDVNDVPPSWRVVALIVPLTVPPDNPKNKFVPAFEDK